MPTLYNLQPTSDYQALISHSVRELEAKTWARTGHGMTLAIQQSHSSSILTAQRAAPNR